MARVFISSVINAPIATVWQHVRDFDALPSWNPGVAESEIEDGLAGDVLGCVRNFRLHDGGRLRERLLALSDHECSCTYSILESPLPLTNYVAHLRLRPITDGQRTYAEWSASFDCTDDARDELIDGIGSGVFLASFHELERQLGSAGGQR